MELQLLLARGERMPSAKELKMATGLDKHLTTIAKKLAA